MTHPTNSSPNPLTERLTHEADQFVRRGGHELDLAQVLDRAGEIKRGRRMRATLVMAACVLAIAVPTALIAANHDTTHAPTPAPAPKVDSSPLSLSGVSQGEAPRIDYLQDGDLHRKGFTYSGDGETYVALAELRDGAMLASRDSQGNLRAHALDGTHRWAMSGDFVASGDGSLVAFVEPDGTPVVVQSGGIGSHRPSYRLPTVPIGSGFDAVAVTGPSCAPTSELGCSVWVTSSGKSPQSWETVSDMREPRVEPEFRTLTDVDSTQTRLAGIIDVRPDLTTCSAVARATNETIVWTTCDFRLSSFSPDDTRLLASGSVGDGLGDTQLAVLDADSGKVRLDLKTADQAFIRQAVWEDDSHLLATVFQDGQWAVLRIGLDGSREYALAPVAGEDADSPYVLPGS